MVPRLIFARTASEVRPSTRAASATVNSVCRRSVAVASMVCPRSVGVVSLIAGIIANRSDTPCMPGDPLHGVRLCGVCRVHPDSAWGSLARMGVLSTTQRPGRDARVVVVGSVRWGRSWRVLGPQPRLARIRPISSASNARRISVRTAPVCAACSPTAAAVSSSGASRMPTRS